MILETVVEELGRRLEQAKDATPKGLLQNRWLQLGVAVAVGYAIGRARARVQLGPFGRSLATAALTTLVRTAMQSSNRNPSTIN